jgi:hypothetical protein
MSNTESEGRHARGEAAYERSEEHVVQLIRRIVVELMKDERTQNTNNQQHTKALLTSRTFVGRTKRRRGQRANEACVNETMGRARTAARAGWSNFGPPQTSVSRSSMGIASATECGILAYLLPREGALPAEEVHAERHQRRLRRSTTTKNLTFAVKSTSKILRGANISTRQQTRDNERVSPTSQERPSKPSSKPCRRCSRRAWPFGGSSTSRARTAAAAGTGTARQTKVEV